MSGYVNYVIADLHFIHEKVAALRGYNSVGEHDKELVDRINSVVRPNDTLIIAGDVTGGGSAGISVLDQIKCRNRRLVGGNHEGNLARYAQYFISMHACFIRSHFIITHIPVHTSCMRWQGNIHGHTHEKSIADSRYLCISAEQINMTPILLDTAIEKIKLANENYKKNNTV